MMGISYQKKRQTPKRKACSSNLHEDIKPPPESCLQQSGWGFVFIIAVVRRQVCTISVFCWSFRDLIFPAILPEAFFILLLCDFSH